MLLKCSSKLRLSLVWPYSLPKLIPDASLLYIGLWYFILWIQQCHSLHTDPSIAFHVHVKIFTHSILYFSPESRATKLPQRHCHISITDLAASLKQACLVLS